MLPALDIDDLTTSMETLLASGREIPAVDLRLFQAKMIAALSVLAARARGNRIFYTSGVPDDALGMEGDMAINRLLGDYYEYKGGEFVFLFNVLPRATPTLPGVPGTTVASFATLTGVPGENPALSAILAQYAAANTLQKQRLDALLASANGSVDTFIEIYNRFLADESVAATLTAQLALKADKTELGKLLFVDVDLSAVNGTFQLPADTRGKRFVLNNVVAGNRLRLPVAYAEDSLNAVFCVLHQNQELLPIYAKIFGSDSTNGNKLEGGVTVQYLACNASVAGVPYSMANRISGVMPGITTYVREEAIEARGVFRGVFSLYTNYGKYDQIVNPAGQLVYAKADFRSIDNYVEADWSPLPGNATAPGTGNVDAYTKAQADTLLATKASRADIAGIIGAAPAALDTLQEIAEQLRADEQGAAAILATQQQHTQFIANFTANVKALLIRENMPAYDLQATILKVADEGEPTENLADNEVGIDAQITRYLNTAAGKALIKSLAGSTTGGGGETPPIPGDMTALAIEPFAVENMARTQDSVRLVTPEYFGKAAWKIKLPAGGSGVVRFRLANLANSSLILAQIARLPTGAANGENDLALLMESVGKIRSCTAGGTDYDVVRDFVEGMEMQGTLNGTTMVWATSTDEGETWSPLPPRAQPDADLFLKVFGGPAAESGVFDIRYSGDFTIVA